MRLLALIPATLISSFLITGCAATKPEAFKDGTPVLDPVAFFTGHVHSTGFFEHRGGMPARRITTETTGILKDSVLYVEQDLAPEGGRRWHRSWQLYKTDVHHINATANDMLGSAHGLAYGNVFRWSFRLALSPGNPLKNVRMTQAMYLQPDGRSLIIRSVIRKAGIVVAQVTEQFWKD